MHQIGKKAKQYRSETSGKLHTCMREQLTMELYGAQISPAEPSPERLGTFQDNLRAPIHRWFKYPAGFSYRLVETLIDDQGLAPGHWLLDPFAGCGTTSMVAKQHRVLKTGSEFVLVLGDSAPYGVYIPTDEYLGELGLAAGFTDYRIRELRERGGKWGHNPQRHKVMLRESLLTLAK